MNSRFAKVISIALLSAFLTGCMGDNSQSNQNNTAEDYEEKSIDDYSKAKADYDYAKDEFGQGNYLNAAKGMVNAVVNFTKSEVDVVLKNILQSRGSFQVDESKFAVRIGNRKRTLQDVAKEFASKSMQTAIDYYDNDKRIPLGQLVMKYSSMIGAERNATPLRQRLVATIQLHESDNTNGNAQLSILCNNDTEHTVDFGIGQVNVKSWTSFCKDLVDQGKGSIVATAFEKCQDYHIHPENYRDPRTGKLIRFKTYIIELFKNKYGSEEALVRNPRSPFNPITNSKCTYRHLEEDFIEVSKMFQNCQSIQVTSMGKFRCTGNPEFDYNALALMKYGGLNKRMLARDVRLGSGDNVTQTFDDYMAEFRAAYAALFKEPPPF